MNTVDLATIEAHLADTPRGLRHFDAHWSVADTLDTPEEWLRIEAILYGATLAASDADIGAWQTAYKLAFMRHDAALAAQRTRNGWNQQGDQQ